MKFVKLLYKNQSNTRKIEKTLLKLIKNKWSILFNETCLNKNILPKYTKIY